MGLQISKFSIDLLLLPDVAIIESYFLWVSQQIIVFWSVLSFQFLLLGRVYSKWGRNQPDYYPWYKVPQNCEGGAFPTD